MGPPERRSINMKGAGLGYLLCIGPGSRVTREADHVKHKAKTTFDGGGMINHDVPLEGVFWVTR